MTEDQGVEPETYDAGELAERVAQELDNSVLQTAYGWGFEGLDIGEINIITDTGQRFRLTVEEVTE